MRERTRVAVSVLVVQIGSSTPITCAGRMSLTSSLPIDGSAYVRSVAAHCA